MSHVLQYQMFLEGFQQSAQDVKGLDVDVIKELEYIEKDKTKK